MKILILEDDTQLSLAIQEYFTLKHHMSVSAHDGLTALQEIDNNSFDLYIIDINVPHVNGLDIIKYIRDKDIHTPIIVISASVEIKNFSKSFEYGCNEYIRKPFHLKELDIRIEHLFASKNNENITISKSLFYDTLNRQFIYQGKPIVLRYKEKRLCSLLMDNMNTLVKNEKICDYVWEGKIKDVYPLRQTITSIRKKLPIDIIHTIVKEGYMIKL